MARQQHVVPRGRKWAVQAEGSARATRLTESKAEAVELARQIARRQGTDVVIHRHDGAAEKEDIFGAVHVASDRTVKTA
jgi:uncharacterized protein YdaT